MKTRIAIAVAGALGMMIILKTSTYYASMDGLAFGLTLVMGAALCAGLWELWTLAGRTESLRSELSSLPRDIDDERLDRLSPMLRALLRARLDRTALPVPGPVFAPYIIGLLVMLGLLGTFLGLFETLRGASIALTTSADVEALRTGLQRPMQGLMRSFGTSATGVAASAMLGLASVFVRRAAGQLGVMLHEVASGPLARYSPAHRQLIALEALSAQGKSLPEAAVALREAGERIDALRTHFSETVDESDKRRAEQQERAAQRLSQQVTSAQEALEQVGARNEKAVASLTVQWEKAHARVAQETTNVLKQTLDQVSASIDRGVVQAAERASETLSPLLSQAVEKTVSAATSHLDAVLSAVHEDAEGRREAQAAATDALQERVTALLGALGTLEAERRAADQEQLTRFEAQTGALLQERSAADEALLKRLSDHLAAYQSSRAEADADALSRLDAHASTIVEALEAHRLGQAERLASQEQTLLAHQRETLAALADYRAQTEAQQSGVLAALAAQAEAAEAAAAERNGQLFVGVEATLNHLQTFASETTERERVRAQEARALSERVTKDMAEAAQLVRERLSRSEEAERTQQERSTALLQRLQGAAETIGKAAESQVGALSEFVRATDERLREAEQKSQARLREFVDSLQAAAEGQQQRLSTLEQRLTEQAQAQTSHFATVQDTLLAQQGERAQALTALFASQLESLQGRLSESTGLINDAAELVKGGGAELITVAETFGAAVEQQRRATQQWLDSLGDIERTVTDAGEAAAADVLGQHLARTHEVFDRQLRFQQELIEQLRNPIKRNNELQVSDATA